MVVKYLTFLIFLITASSLKAQSDKKLLKEGNDLYEEKKFSEAEINYRKSLEKTKDPAKANFNLGDALYKQGKYDEAASQFQQLSSADIDNHTKAKAYHNLGNSLLKANKLEESIQAYKNALRNVPDDQETKYNLAYAKTKLIQQQQQQKNKNDKKDKNKKDKDKDKKEEENKEEKGDKEDKGEKDKGKEGDKKDKDKEGKESQEDPKDAKDGKPRKSPKQLSPQDAQRMLDALNQQEMDLQKKLTKKEAKRSAVEKNW